MKDLIHSLSFTGRYLKPYSGKVFLDMSSSVLVRVIDIANAYILGRLVAAALAGNTSGIWMNVGIMGSLSLVYVLANYLTRITFATYAALATRDLRDHLLDKMQRIPLAYYEDEGTSEAVSTTARHTWNVQNFLESYYSGAITEILALLAASIYLFTIDARLCLLSLVVLPISIFIGNLTSRSISQYSNKYYERWKSTTLQIQDTIAGAPIIRTFQLKEMLISRYKKDLDEMLKQNMKIVYRRAFIEPVSNVINVVVPALCLILGGYLAVRGEMSAANLVVCIQLVRMITKSVGAFPEMIFTTRELMVSVGKLKTILGMPEEPRAGNKDPQDRAMAVSFQNVTFSYGDHSLALDDVVFDVPVGSTVALVGESGSGKSTALKLMQAMHTDLAGGCIKIMGCDIREWDLSAMRENIALVPQDIFLFPGTVYENIAYGRENAATDEVYSASKAAGAHEFILMLPEGYDTIVGERGIKLSGGQKQRLAIARAFLKNAPMLMLDEPTSALDNITEKAVQESLDRLMEGRTVIVVAHRLSTIKNADQVIVLDRGRVVEMGGHDELLRKDGAYARIYARQFEQGEAVS